MPDTQRQVLFDSLTPCTLLLILSDEMKFSYCLSFIPVLAFLTTTVLAYPIHGAGSAIEARDDELNDLESRFAFTLEDGLFERTILSKGRNLLAKIGIGKKKVLSEEQKKAKISKMEKKFNKKAQKHHVAVAKVEHGHTGLTINKYSGKDEHKKLAEQKVHSNYKMFPELHKFGKADVHVNEEPGKLHITAQYHNGPGNSKSSPFHIFHHHT